MGMMEPPKIKKIFRGMFRRAVRSIDNATFSHVLNCELYLEILCYTVLTRQKYSVKIACGSAGNFSGLAVNKLRDC